MDPKTITDLGKLVTDLGAFGVILVSFFGAGIWLFRYYLPQQREDFKNMLEGQRHDSIKALDNIVSQFKAESQVEREIHLSIQNREQIAHQTQIEEITSEILAFTQDIHRLNTQFSHFTTIWIGTLTNKPEMIIDFFQKLNELNHK